MKREFNFVYSISTKEYDRNRDVRSTGRLTWREKQGTSIKDLENDITSGFAYCPTFYHKGDTFTNGTKTQKNLKATYFITFDFDAVKLTVSEFYGKMICSEIPPSLVYTTANNGKFKEGKNERYNNRYRVIYALDEPITTAETYTALHQALKAEIATTVDDNNLFNDNSDKDVSHFFAGCINADTYSNSRTTPLTWLADRYDVDITNNMGIRTQCNDNRFSNDGASAFRTKRESAKKMSCVDIKERKRHYTTQGHQIALFQDFINDYENSDKSFMDLAIKYCRELPLLPEETPVTFDKGELYKEVEPNHIRIVKKRIKTTKKGISGNDIEVWEYYKFKDGEVRKRKLYLYLQMVKDISPHATMEELLWNAVNWVVEQTNNTIDPISKKQVIDAVMGAMKRKWTPSEKSKGKYSPKIALNKELAKKRHIPIKTLGLLAAHESKTKQKEEKWAKIAKLYDATKTNKENVEIMKEAGIDVTTDYLKKWKYANGLTKQGKQSRSEQIGRYYDATLTDLKNLEILQANGIKISLRTLKTWKIENGYTKKHSKATKSNDPQ